MGDEIPTNPEVNKTPAVAPVASPVVPLEVPEERGKKMFMIIGVVAAVIVVLVIGVVFLSMGGGEDSDLENGEVAGDEGSDSGASGNTPEETPPVDESGPGADDQSVGDEVPPISEKDGALEFSLKVVKSYFDKDCDTYYNSYQETIYLLDDDGPVEKSSYNKEEFCESMLQAVEPDYTYQDYLDSYETRILEKSEYEIEFPSLANLTKFQPSESDYLFRGGSQKDPSSTNFIWDDMYSFMVGKSGGEWKIVAGSG